MCIKQGKSATVEMLQKQISLNWMKADIGSKLGKVTIYMAKQLHVSTSDMSTVKAKGTTTSVAYTDFTTLLVCHFLAIKKCPPFLFQEYCKVQTKVIWRRAVSDTNNRNLSDQLPLPFFISFISFPNKGTYSVFTVSFLVQNGCESNFTVSGKQLWRWDVICTVPVAGQQTQDSCPHRLFSVPFSLV